jgi:TANFOR domain-containing protein
VRYLKTILLFFFIASQVESVGQVFPVQSTVQLTPPYSLYLSDYAAPGSERLRVTAFLIDATRPELNVRFRLRIEGNGIKIETKPEFLPPPITLLGGVPLQLISSDLAAYFDPRNLNFTGITQREVEQRGALPEGLYQFCFEVIEYNRGAKISNTGCAVAWLILNDPPIVNLPRDNEKIRIQDPQQVIFQWTPRHRGSPNSAFNAEYDFKLVEVWPSTRNPNDAILTLPAIFQTTTSETTLIYGPAETPLEPGRRYAFQLRARAYAGADEVSLFKNNGFSQVYTFVYGDACLAPQNIITSDIGTTRFSVNFDGASNQTGYSLRYRLSPNPQSPSPNWYTTTSLTPNLTINSLQPNTRYEYQLTSSCGTFTSDYSPLTNIATKDNPGIQYSCGVPLTPFNLDPSQLIDVLKVGDIIKAGDFDVVLSKVTGSKGVFSGEGVIEVSYFNRAKVKAEFTNISISKEWRMVNGYMNVTGAGVEIVPANLLNLMDDLDEVLAKADKFLDEYEANLPEQFDENAAVTSTLITVPGTATVLPATNGSVVIVDGSGKRTEIPVGTTASVVDGSGKGYIIDSKGKVHTTTAAIATQAANREYSLKLKFAASAEQKFGFDEKRYDPIASTYTKVQDQYLSWKSVATGQTDKVIATLEGTGIDKTKIRYELGGLELRPQDLGSQPQSPSPNPQVLELRGTADGLEEELIALYNPNPQSPSPKTQVLGKLSVVTYDEIVKDLVIVPVNGNKYPYGEDALRTQLNKIYGQAVVKWNITFAQNFDVQGIDPFDDGGSGLLSNYSPDMRKVVSAYKANIQPHTYYLFLVKNPKAGTLAGYMPRSKECGFIFIDKNGSEEAIIHTMAHELGHGAFSLRHTFAEEKNTLTEKSTDNLMDYANGTKLYKYQWDRMRYPEIVMGLFEDDEDSAYEPWAKLDGDVIAQIPGFEKKSISFLSPSSSIITLPINARDYTFNNGYLIGFTIESVRYFAFNAQKSKKFKGYFSDAKEAQPGSYDISKSKPFEGKLDATTQQPLILYITASKSSCGSFKIFSATYKPSVAALNYGGPGVEIDLQKDISGLTQILSNSKEIGTVKDRINCLSGRLKEVYKFIIEHYSQYKQPLSDTEKDELINQLSPFTNAYVTGLDTIPASVKNKATVKMREMLTYGVTEFTGKLKELNQSIASPTSLVVEFEDIERLRDAYLIYQVSKKVDVDCKFAEDLQAVIDKQVAASGQVIFNLEFIGALGKTTYSIISGNETFELLNCLLKNLKASESLYNPNRLDYQLQGFVQELFESYLGLNKNELVSKVGQGIIQYPFACNCGAWNSLVDLVYGLSELGAGVTQPPGDIARKSKEFLNNIKNNGLGGMGSGIWELIKEHHGYSSVTGFDSYQATYSGCYDVIFVASFFVGVGELKALSKAGDLSDIAKILVKSAKAYPATIAQIANRTAQFTSKTVRNFTLEILEKLPTSLYVQLPADAKAIILATAFNEGVRLASITDDGIKFLVPLARNSERGSQVIYQSTKPIRNVDSGKDVVVKFIKKEDGSFGYVIDEVLQGAGNELTPLLLKSGEEFTILTNARKLPGTSIGNGKNITGTWLRGTERNAGLFPKSVADKLKGKTFTSFDDFRNQFWKAVADEPSLASQFDANSIQRMQGGLAPFTDVSQQIGGMKNYVLHHKTPINQGGAVYDMDNLYIVTPKYHKEILDPAYHYGYGY